MANTDSLASIIEVINKFKEKHFSFKKKKFGTYLDRSSISKATKDLIASFPVMCSDTITPAVASMVAKATERNCVVMLQLLFSSVYLKGSSGREVLSKWHTNMDNDINMDDLLDIMDSFSEDAKTISDREFNEIIKEMGVIIRDNILAEKTLYPISSFSTTSINDYIVTEDYKGDTVVIVNEKSNKVTIPPAEVDLNDPLFNIRTGGYIPNPNQNLSGPFVSANNKYNNNNVDTDYIPSMPNAYPDATFGSYRNYIDYVKAKADALRVDLDYLKANQDFIDKNLDREAQANAKQATNNLTAAIANMNAADAARRLEFEYNKLGWSKDCYEDDIAYKNKVYDLNKSIADTNDKNKKAELAHNIDVLNLRRMEYFAARDEFYDSYKLKEKEFEYRKAHDIDLHKFEKEKFKRQKKQEDIKNKLEKDKFEWKKKMDMDNAEREKYRQLQTDMRDTTDFFQKQLLSTDVKKYNELVPSLLVIRFQAVDPDDDGGINNYRVDSQCIIGVKTRLIPVDSFDIINHMRSIEKNKLSLVNLVRATTKEISFCRDYIAAIDQAKIDAKQNSRLSKSSPIWRLLQNRSNRSVYSRLKKRRANDAGAITTLVVSIEEVNALKKEFDIDLTDPMKAKYMMKQYNLLSFVIVDEQVEVVRFLYDGEKYFQDFAFSMLERETGDNSYKKVVNLISKLNRG